MWNSLFGRRKNEYDFWSGWDKYEGSGFTWDDFDEYDLFGNSKEERNKKRRRKTSLIVFVLGALLASLSFLVFGDLISQVEQKYGSEPVLYVLLLPGAVLGFVYGSRIAERIMEPDRPRGQIKNGFLKGLLLLFMIGSLFSPINFAVNGGQVNLSSHTIMEGLAEGDGIDTEELKEWFWQFVDANGGTAYLVVSFLTLISAATTKIARVQGFSNRVISFVGTFIFVSMILMAITHNNPSTLQIYMYTAYHAGIIAGAFYQINKAASKKSHWREFAYKW